MRGTHRLIAFTLFALVTVEVGGLSLLGLLSLAPGLWIPVAVVGVLVVATVLIHRYERRIGLRDASAHAVRPASGSARESGV